jgi:hypothetical protein
MVLYVFKKWSLLQKVGFEIASLDSGEIVGRLSFKLNHFLDLVSKPGWF